MRGFFQGETMKVCLLLANGFEELEAVGTFALLKRAGLDVDLIALTSQDTTGRFGLCCTQLKPLSQSTTASYDAVVLPGGPGYQILEQSPEVKQLIEQFIAEGKLVAAICASPTILGKRGYLKGKKYTCFTAMNEDFGGTFTGSYAETDGNIITGQSAAGTIDFAFAIIEKLLGKAKADEVKKKIYYK